jgi:hypothetical protein
MITKRKDKILATEICTKICISLMFLPNTISYNANTITIEADNLLVCEKGSKSKSFTAIDNAGCGLVKYN